MNEEKAVSHHYGNPEPGLWQGVWENIGTSKGWSRRGEGLHSAGLVFVIDGCVRASVGGGRRRIRGGQLFLVPPRTPFSGFACGDSHILICRFRPEEVLAAYPRTAARTQPEKKRTGGFTKLSFSGILAKYLSLLEDYMRTGAAPALFDIKKKELFYLLSDTYRMEDLTGLLGPVVGKGEGFRAVVMDNYEKTDDLNKLAAMTNYSRVGFNLRFREVFGMSPGKWMAARKAERIREDIGRGLSPKELAAKYEFSSPQHLLAFCKKHFGKTVRELYGT